MKQRMIHGGTIDAVTTRELEAALASTKGDGSPELTIIRAGETVTLDASGNGFDEVYKVPLGMRFKLRRVSFNLLSASDPVTGNVPLNATGHAIVYLASDAFLEYANPSSAAGIPSVPGVQTWSADEGPHFTNGQVFGVKAIGLTANATLDVLIQGMLYDEKPNRGGGR